MNTELSRKQAEEKLFEYTGIVKPQFWVLQFFFIITDAGSGNCKKYFPRFSYTDMTTLAQSVNAEEQSKIYYETSSTKKRRRIKTEVRSLLRQNQSRILQSA